MKKQLFFLSLIGVSLSSCSMVKETFNALEANRQAVDMSTYVINENTAAIEQANIRIQENRQQIEHSNETLKKAAHS